MADTQAVPAIVRALSGVLPESAVRSLMQALGNCNQPYASRNQTNVQPNEYAGNRNGVYSGDAWNPNDYAGLLPDAGSPGSRSAELPRQGGYTNGDWNSVNYGGNAFWFPTSQQFALNNFYGGPVMNVGGNSYFYNQSVSNQNVTNQTVSNFNTTTFNTMDVAGDPDAGDPSFPGGGGTTRGAFPGAPFIFPPIILGPPNRRTTPRAEPDGRPAVTSGFVIVPNVTSVTLGEDCKITVNKTALRVQVQLQQ